MAQIIVDEDFNRIVQLDIKMKISDAFILLGYRTKKMSSEQREEIFKKKANQLKTEMNAYIDSLTELMSK